MKKFALLLLLFLLFLASACDGGRGGIRMYETDFTETYYETLNVMFDHNWTILSAEERFEENEGYICDCGFDGRAQQFMEWTIEYTDGSGDRKHFVLSNRSSFSQQVQNYLANAIAQYYEENFFHVYISDVPLAPSSSVSAFWVRNFGRSTGDDENKIREMEDAAQKYLWRLSTPEGAVRFSQLTPATVFEQIPMYLSLRVSFDGGESLGQEMEEQVMKNIEAMIESMQVFTNHTLNATFAMGYREVIDLHTGSRNYHWHYVQGERIAAPTRQLKRDVFESYRGVFW